MEGGQAPADGRAEAAVSSLSRMQASPELKISSGEKTNGWTFGTQEGPTGNTGAWREILRVDHNAEKGRDDPHLLPSSWFSTRERQNLQRGTEATPEPHTPHQLVSDPCHWPWRGCLARRNFREGPTGPGAQSTLGWPHLKAPRGKLPP